MSRPPSQKKRPIVLATSVAALLSLGFLLAAPKAAADEYWDGTTTTGSGVTNGQGGAGTWDNTLTNWVDATGHNQHVYDPNQLAIFSTLGGTVILGSNIKFTALQFAANGYDIAPGVGPFTLTPTGTAKITVNSGDAVTIDPQIVGTGGISVLGQGSVTLTSATSNYSGGTTLGGTATLSVKSGNALGTGTLTITGSGSTLSSPVDGTAIPNAVSIQTNTFNIGTSGAGGNFTLNGNINLNGATRTIVGITNAGQVHFGTGGIGTAGEKAGLNLNTIFTATGDYVAFITDSGYVSHYTGLTTINNGAFLVFGGSAPNVGIIGDVDVEGNGVIDYLSGNPSQIADTSTVTVNSNGNTAGGTFFGGLDLFNSSAETIGALNGSGVVALGAANLSVGSGTFSGEIFDGAHLGISGGSLTKISPGTLILSGTNTYTGSTTVNGGELILLGSITSPVTVNSTGTFTLGTSATVTPPVAGTTPVTLTTNATFNNFGTLTNSGAGSVGVSVTGPGSYVANNAGAVISGETGVKVTNTSGVSTVSNVGTITGTGGTAIDAHTSAGVTIGDFGKFNGSVLLGTGTNTVVIATNEPFVPIAGVGSNNTLRLIGSTEAALKPNVFTNYQALQKAGGGTWNLTGTNSFIKGTSIEAGTLNVQGNLISNAVVHSEGTLAGTGALTGNLMNFGNVNPGTPTDVVTTINMPGTLSVKGNYTQNAVGTLTIQVNGTDAGQFSRLAIAGQAQLDGNLVVQNGAGKAISLKMGQKVIFLTAAGGVSGTFSQVTDPFAGGTIIVGKVVYDPNDVALEGTQGSFLSIDSQFHLTPNQRAVATMLDRVASDPHEAKLISFLDNRPLKDLPGDFNHIAPEEMASIYRLGVSLADVQAHNIQRRSADLRAGNSGFNSADFQANGAGGNYSGGLAGPNGNEGKTAEAQTPDHRWGAYIKGVGDFVHVGDTDNARAYDLNTGGVTVGADYRLTPHLAVGVTAGYTGTEARLTEGRLTVNGGKGGVYGVYFDKGYYVDGAVTAGANSYSTRRGSVEGNAYGHTQGSEVNVLVDTGYDWQLDALTIGPTAAFQYTYIGIDGFTEHGSLAPLRYLGQHESSIRSTFGLRMAYNWKVGGVLVRPELQLAWQHEYGDRSYSIDAALAGDGNPLFSVSDSMIGRDSLLFGAGVAVLWNPRTSTFLYYDADLLKKEYNGQSVNGGLRLNF